MAHNDHPVQHTRAIAPASLPPAGGPDAPVYFSLASQCGHTRSGQDDFQAEHCVTGEHTAISESAESFVQHNQGIASASDDCPDSTTDVRSYEEAGWTSPSLWLRRQLSFFLRTCTVLFSINLCIVYTAFQANDVIVMNLAAVDACFPLIAILHVWCLRHAAQASDGSWHTSEAAAQSWSHIVRRPSVLVASSFAWVAGSFFPFVPLLVVALLRLPIPLCDLRAETREAGSLFPECRLISDSAEAFVYLDFPYRITVAVILVLGILHAAFNFCSLSMGYTV